MMIKSCCNLSAEFLRMLGTDHQLDSPINSLRWKITSFSYIGIHLGNQSIFLQSFWGVENYFFTLLFRLHCFFLGGKLLNVFRLFLGYGISSHFWICTREIGMYCKKFNVENLNNLHSFCHFLFWTPQSFKSVFADIDC